MVRQARIVMPGVPHHVTQRGNYRQEVFFADEDRREYLQLLQDSSERFGLGVSGYCLMSNHVHLIVIPEHDYSLAKALGRAHLMYAQYMHGRYERQGHLWQGRFYSNPMDTAHAWNALAYVELNPVRAGIVDIPWEYPWSSAAAHCNVVGSDSGLLSLTAWRQETTPTEWQDTLRAIAGKSELHEEIRIACRSGRPLGDSNFISRVESQLGHGLPRIGAGRPKGSKDTHKRRPKN